MTQQERRTSVDGTYVGSKRRGKSLKKLVLLLLGGVLRVERQVDTYYARRNWVRRYSIGAVINMRDVIVWVGEFLAFRNGLRCHVSREESERAEWTAHTFCTAKSLNHKIWRVC